MAWKSTADGVRLLLYEIQSLSILRYEKRNNPKYWKKIVSTEAPTLRKNTKKNTQNKISRKLRFSQILVETKSRHL